MGAHARDEVGLTKVHTARPIQAVVSSAATFAVGAGLPLLLSLITPRNLLIPAVAGASLLGLAFLGAMAAWTGGANVAAGAGRVTVWGALAMAATVAAGSFFGA